MNAIDLKEQKAVVTGAARGIGYAIAERLLHSGAAVTIWDVDEAAAREAATRLGTKGEAHALAVDVTDEGSVKSAVEATAKRLGRIDILVNNAGVAGSNAPTWEYSSAEWRRVIEIDLVGVYLCAAAVLPDMIARGYGRVVNIASVAGKEGNPNASAYSAAKAGVIALTKSIGKETAKTGVVVNCVTPAAVETDIFAQMSKEHIDYMLSKIPMGRFGKVDEIAALVAWLASKECSFSTGATFDISGGRATY
jgi:NAD(P)-dependent dehydrogenase (short-subunit alcohol dehydrogenase family)